MKKYIIVKADSNDADYVTDYTEITDEQIEEIRPVIEAIKNAPKDKYGWGHNWETGEVEGNQTPENLYIKTGILTKEQVRLFDEFVPLGDPNYPGVHTIERVIIVEEKEILFKRK